MTRITTYESIDFFLSNEFKLVEKKYLEGLSSVLKNDIMLRNMNSETEINLTHCISVDEEHEYIIRTSIKKIKRINY